MSAKNKRQQAHRHRQQQSQRASLKDILRRAQAGPAAGMTASPLRERAIELWNRNEFDAALEAFAAAHRKLPGDAIVLCDYAKALALRYRRDEAVAQFEAAIAARPGDPFPCIRAGEAFVEAQEFERAHQYFARAAGLRHCGVGAFLGLARICERLHRLEEAREALDQARAIQPDLPVLRVMEARVARRQGETARAESLLRTELAEPMRDHEARWRAHYELAALLDQRGDYDGAFQAATAAKQVVGLEAGRFRTANAAAEKESAALLAALTPEHFRRWAGAAEPTPPVRPLAVLTGYPRSGTTLLEQVLDSHDGLVSADESLVMGDDVISPLRLTQSLGTPYVEVLDDAAPSDLGRFAERYFRHSEIVLGQRVGERVLLDKNPALTLALPSVFRVFPHAKMLIALRDPRDVCVSCFFQPVPPNGISVQWLTLADTVRHCALYLRAWVRLRALLPPTSWLEVRYEETVADLETQARAALAFLGLEWDPRVLAFHRHAREKHVHSPTYEAVTRPVYTSAVGRWRNYQNQLAPVMPALESLLAEVGVPSAKAPGIWCQDFHLAKTPLHAIRARSVRSPGPKSPLSPS